MKSYDLDIVGQVSPELALMEAASEIKEGLGKRFGNDYDITEGPIARPETTWSHEIKIRKGNKIGAVVTLRWHNHTPAVIQLNAANSSKLGSLLSYVVIIGSSILGAVLAYNNVAPLGFLPGKTIAAGLGALLFLMPGVAITYISKKIIFKDVKKENEALLEEVINFLTALNRI